MHKRKVNPKDVTDAKLSAMISDLSPEAVAGFVTLVSGLETKVRDLIRYEWCEGNIEPDLIIAQWEADE